MYVKSEKTTAKRDNQIARPRRAQTCARWECARKAGRFFNPQLDRLSLSIITCYYLLSPYNSLF